MSETRRTIGDLDTPIWGAVAISHLINRTTRQTFRLLETGELPARKIGGRWATTQRQLRAVFERDADQHADTRQEPPARGRTSLNSSHTAHRKAQNP
jgi:hypothetical protein